MLKDVLVEYGLSEKESEVYLMTLELGQVPVSTIARQCGMNRVTVYSILRKLHAQGIIHTIEKGSTTFYSAENPEILLSTFEKKYTQFQEAMPEFMAIAHKYDNKPKVKLYEGFEGLKNLYDTILHSAENFSEDECFLCFTGTQEIDEKFERYLMGPFMEKRLSIPTKTKSIITEKESDYHDYTKKYHDFVVLDEPLFDLGNEIVIYDHNKIAVLMYGSEEMSGLMIESQTLHNALKSMFEFIWKAQGGK